MRRIVSVLVFGVIAIAAAAPGFAEDQTVDATLGNTIAMSTAPDASVSGWALASTGANTTSGGTMEISSNEPYTVAVTADKATMTEWITASSAYEATSPKSLTTAMSITAARTGGTAATPGVGATATIGTTTTVATGTGLGTDTYSITLSQPTVVTDPALATGRTYHIVLTYTASSTL